LDLIVFGGDFIWGLLFEEIFVFVVGFNVRFVCGNVECVLFENEFLIECE